jgi:predicted MFS family arabinose efflux permease
MARRPAAGAEASPKLGPLNCRTNPALILPALIRPALVLSALILSSSEDYIRNPSALPPSQAQTASAPARATIQSVQETKPGAALTALLAASCGIVVASLYYIQPIVGVVSRDYGLPVAMSGALVTVTQLGYAAGLLFIVPLGDIAENRRLILTMLSVLVVALAIAFKAPTILLFLIASLAIGISSSAVQVIVPLAGHLSDDATRGRVVGNVVSGLLFGIMLSRPAASFAAHAFGARSIYAVSAGLTVLLILLLRWRLPCRRPQGQPYGAMLASLWPLLRDTEVLHRRAGYQAAMFGAFSLFWTAAPLLLEGPRFHFSQVAIGLFALVGAGGALVSPFAGRAADAGRGHLVTGVALVAAALSFAFAVAGGILTSWVLLTVAALILDMAVAATLVIGQREIFALGPETRGRLNGLYLALFFAGGACGSFAAGLAMAHGGWTVAALVGAAFPLAALVYFASERP